MNGLDRVQYAHSIDTANLDYTTAIATYFDQLMGLYGLIQPCNYGIKIVNPGNDTLVLDIKFVDQDSAFRVSEVLKGSDNRFSIYGKLLTFNVLDVSLDTVQVHILTE